MQDIIIACTGGFAMEIYAELEEANRLAQTEGREAVYRVLGFLSDVPARLPERVKEPVLGPIVGWKPIGDERVMIGLARPEQKRKVSAELKKNGVLFETFISPYARVPEGVKLGEGCFVSGGSAISCGAEIGSFVNIQGSLIYGGAVIGDYSTATGFTVVEESVIGEGVFLGSKAVITEGCHVGDWSNVAAGSVVMSDVRPNATVFGMPAQEMG